ncbi:MAG: GNAT family N-acetyltransferase [Holophagales bacterium]|nr:GNAT family N-acetyltransferase [Holophagales bacterium]
MTDPDMHLRSATPKDKGRIHRLFCVPEVYEYLADGKEPPPGIAYAWVDSAAADFAEYGGGLWVLVDEADLSLGGLVRLAGDSHGELELTYLLHPSVWGFGFATRMAHTVMQRAFEAGLVSTIWAGADVPNKSSIAVMERLGMQFRREVQYPLGAGVEYEMKAVEFDPARIEPLPIA